MEEMNKQNTSPSFIEFLISNRVIRNANIISSRDMYIIEKLQLLLLLNMVGRYNAFYMVTKSVFTNQNLCSR